MKNEHDWEKLGSLSKKIRNDLFDLKQASQELKLSKRDMHAITRAIAYVDKYRSDAENLMFSKGIGNVNVFYGRDSK
ncbi:hypothetical protein Q0N88_11000 [Bacillus thuringiensis]|uniref:hypothetical protein n=1 Tax=Bacillus thuringiensis TaxID=1428 RepID=UPI00345AE9E8